MTQQPTNETESEFICRRTKEILGAGGFNWEDFSTTEKLIAVEQAEKEYHAIQATI